MKHEQLEAIASRLVESESLPLTDGMNKVRIAVSSRVESARDRVLEWEARVTQDTIGAIEGADSAVQNRESLEFWMRCLNIIARQPSDRVRLERLKDLLGEATEDVMRNAHARASTSSFSRAVGEFRMDSLRECVRELSRLLAILAWPTRKA